MASLEQNIAQAISDFDDIERALEEQGVDVPEGTDTSEYGNLVRSIKTGDDSPIKYVVSPDADGNTVYLRDLESGSYVLNGAFRPFNGSGNVCRFSSDLLVNVVKGTLQGVPTSHIQIFYPVHNVVQFVDVTDSTYERTDIKLNDLAKMETVEEMVAAANIAANNLYGNAIKASASGEIVRVDDVSPIEHTAKVKVRVKNLFDYTRIVATDTYQKFKVSVKAGTAYTVSSNIPKNTAAEVYFNGDYTDVNGVWEGQSRTFIATTDEMYVAFQDRGSLQSVLDGTYYVQMEQGDTATEYEPYIDPSTVTLTRCGKNLVTNLGKSTEGTGITWTNNGDGTITANGTAETQCVYGFDVVNSRYSLIGKTVILSGCPAGGGLDKYSVVQRNYGKFDTGNSISFVIDNDNFTAWGIRIEAGVTVSNLVFKPQLELGDITTAFEASRKEDVTPSADGACEIVSVSPTMTLLTDTEGAIIDCEYNQDANKALGAVNADLRELDKVTAELMADMGDIETALNRIIAIQEALIGGAE